MSFLSLDFLSFYHFIELFDFFFLKINLLGLLISESECNTIKPTCNKSLWSNFYFQNQGKVSSENKYKLKTFWPVQL